MFNIHVIKLSDGFDSKFYFLAEKQHFMKQFCLKLQFYECGLKFKRFRLK